MLENRIQTLKNTFTSHERQEVPRRRGRQKRSWIPWGGKLLKTVFGTATEGDLVGLRQAVRRLQARQDSIVQILDDSLTMVNKSNEHINANSDAINMLRNCTDGLYQRFRQFSQFTEGMKLDLYLRRLAEAFETTLDQLEFSILQVEERIDLIHFDLEQALQEKLTVTLIDPDDLRTILDSIAGSLPPSMQLLNYEGNNILWYYKHLPVTVIPDEGSVHILTVIPLIYTEEQYTLYEVVNIPVPVLNSNLSRKAQVESQFMAVKGDDVAYALVSTKDAIECKMYDLGYCPLQQLNKQFYDAKTCISSLYTGDEQDIADFCIFELSDSVQFPIMRHLVHGNWLMATSVDFEISVRCPDQTMRIKIPVTAPSTVVSIQSGCTATTPFGRLYSFFHKQTSRNNLAARYLKLDVGANFTAIEAKNATYVYRSKTQKPLPTLPRTLGKIRDNTVGKLKNDLDKLRHNTIFISGEDSLNIIIVAVVAGIITLAGIIIGIVLLLRYCKTDNDNGNDKKSTSKSKKSKLKSKERAVSYSKADPEVVVVAEHGEPEEERGLALLEALQEHHRYHGASSLSIAQQQF